ncbi:metalloprotease [Stagonosporopsis vannaccii]|nr:metalloprotease [Stagonosporopsis vannaccii]
MVTTAIWAIILASTTCASSYAPENRRTAPIRDVTSICGTAGGKASSTRQQVQRRNPNPAFQSNQAVNSSVLLPIDVYMQVLSADGTEAGGDISDATIDAQLQILDNAFRPVGFRFNLKETIRTTNARWYYNLKIATPLETEVPLALRKGDNATLNIFTMGGLNTSTSAWATLPSELQWRPVSDGVYQNGTVMLGGSDPNYTKGITLVHEVGHWFGLYHTFAFGCEKSYDYVADTPIEDQPMFLGGCEIGRDSCPDQPGLDSIHNYMSYSDDDCRDSWTPGQIQRMREQMAKFRGVVYPGIDVDNIPEDTLE